MSDEPSGQATAAPLEVLLRLQEIDTGLGQLLHRKASLPERAQLSAVEEQRGQLDQRIGAIESERSDLATRQDELDRQVSTLTARRRSLEDRLYGARGSPSRDLQAIEGEVMHLNRRRAELEEVELELMERLEDIDSVLTPLSDERRELSGASEALRRTLENTESTLDTEIASLRAERSSLAGQLPSELATRYESIRARLGGVGAARLVGNRCEGCHLELPSMEIDRIRRLPPDAIVTCEQCGRILVRAPDRS